MSEIEKALEATEQHLFQWAQNQPPLGQEITRYLLKAGGKRVRPFVFLTWTALLGDILPEHIQVASLIELLHTATLLHDDVVDHSDKRRGQKSAHRQYGRRESIATGDFIFAQVFDALLQIDPALIHPFTSGVQALSQGELQQLSRCGQIHLDEAEYFQIITGKTARLFEMMLWMASALSRAPEKIPAARDFGMALGLLFQIGDDVLDYRGHLGKTPGDDLRDAKITLPLIYAARKNPKHAKRFIAQAFETPEQAFPDVLRWLHQENVWEQIEVKTQAIAQEAAHSLNHFEDGHFKQTLLDLIQNLLNRASFHGPLKEIL